MRLLGFDISRGATPGHQRESGDRPWYSVFETGASSDTDKGLPPVSQRSVTGIPALFSGLRHIGDTIAALPIEVLWEDSEEPVPATHWLRMLIDRPNPLRRRNAWHRMMLYHLCLFGNFVSLRIPNGLGQVARLRPLDPPPWTRLERVGRDPDMLESYDVLTPDQGSQTTRVPLTSVWWVSGMAFDGFVAPSPLAQFKDSWQLMLAVTTYGRTFFADAAIPYGILTPPRGLTDGQIKDARTNWRNMKFRREGGHGVAVMPSAQNREAGDWQFQTISTSPDEAAALPLSEFNITEAARILKIPVTKLGLLDNATYANIGEEAIAYSRDTIAPWVQVLEDAWQDLVPDGERPVVVRYGLATLTAGTQKERFEAYSLATGGAPFMLPDEVRGLENLGPMEDMEDDEDSAEPEITDDDQGDDSDAQGDSSTADPPEVK